MVGSLSSSALLSYYNGQSALSLLSGINSGSTDLTSAIYPDTSSTTAPSPASLAPAAPWATQNGVPAVSDAVRNAINGANLIDPSAAKLSAPAGTSTSDYKNLFALYQGLNTLYDLAQTATQTGANASSYSTDQLQTAFNSGLQQLQSFMASSPFKGFNISQGAVNTQVQSSVAIGSPTIQSYTTGVVFTGDQSLPVPAFQNGAQFTITLQSKYTTTPTPVNIDLADLGGRPATMNNVVNYINSKLKAAGAVSQFSVASLGNAQITTNVGGTKTTTNGDPQWGFQISGSSSETVSFSAPSSAAAVYIGQETGGTKTTASDGSAATTVVKPQLLKLQTDNNVIGTPPVANATLGDGTLPVGGVFAHNLPDGVTDVKASAAGADGSVYVLGDAVGAVQGASVQGSQGVALMKYDGSGQLVYSKLLSQGADSTGLGLAVAADGTVAVTGANTSTTGKSTAFVQVFDPAGVPSWSQTIPASGGATTASGVAFAADGSVYVSGTTTGSVGNQLVKGISDEFIQGFSKTGTATFTTQYGTAGVNTSSGIAYDATTNSLYTAGLEQNNAVVRSFALNGAAAPTASGTRNLGVADGVVGIGVSNGVVSLGGTVAAGGINAGTVTQAFTGVSDAFVANISTSLAPSGSDNVAYFGIPGATQTATAFTLAGGHAYVTGTIADDPSSLAKAGATEGFVNSVDVTTGAVTSSTTMAGALGQDAPSSIAVSTKGSSILDAFGLPNGVINAPESNLIIANSSVKAGDKFYIRTSPGGAQQAITITATDTLDSLMQKVQGAIGAQGTASIISGSGGGTLEIQPASGDSFIQLDAYPYPQDLLNRTTPNNALAALGLTEGVVRAIKTVNNGLNDPSQLREYSLRMTGQFSIGTLSGANTAMNVLQAAMGAVQNAYTDLVTPPTLASEALAKANSAGAGAVPAYLTAQIANYQAGLNRLLGGG